MSATVAPRGALEVHEARALRVMSHPAFDGDFDLPRFSLADGEVTEHAKSEEVFTGAVGPRGRLAFESGRPIAHVARDLGVESETLRKYVRQCGLAARRWERDEHTRRQRDAGSDQ